jgi:hypothetical protein
MKKESLASVLFNLAGGRGWCDAIHPFSDGNLLGYPPQKQGESCKVFGRFINLCICRKTEK